MAETGQLPRRALVTGASGYIGSHLARRLIADGWDVHVLLRHDSRDALLDAAREHLVVHRIGGDTAGIVEAVRRAAPDVVFHLAAAFMAEHVPGDVAPLVQSNLLFGTQLLEAMHANGVRLFINTGTAWQHYGNRDYDPVNLYAATKQAFEAILTYYVSAHGFAATTLVLFDTYGPDDPRPKLMRALWQAAARGAPLAMTSGEQVLDLVFVDDVVEAFLAAERSLRAGPPGLFRYGVSSGAPLRLRDLVACFEAVAGLPLDIRWGARPDRARDPFTLWTGFVPPPGWRPRVGLTDGLRRSKPSPASSGPEQAA